jgi:hypothetical protein
MGSHIVFQCPICQSQRLTAPEPETAAVGCDGCGWSRDEGVGDFREGVLQRCRICGCDDLWRQKDFPPALGLLIVATAAIGSAIAWYLYYPIASMSFLFAAALLDMFLYVFMGDMLVCYRCGARHRQASLDQNHPKHDLETAERYRQQFLRQKSAGG